MKQMLQKIKRVLLTIGRMQTIILMGFVYYLVMGPMAILYQLFKQKQQTKRSDWVKREIIQDWDTYLRRQF